MTNANFIAKIVPIRGIIVSGIPLPEQLLGRVTLSENIVKSIEDLEKEEKVKAIIFEINSSGGMPYPVKEIADAIKKCQKITVARIREYGTSGAYWVASACKKIVADPLSQIGGIGVRAERFDFSGLLEKIGIKIHQFTTGKYKGIGSPYAEMTEEEREYIQGLIDTINQHFIQEIRE